MNKKKRIVDECYITNIKFVIDSNKRGTTATTHGRARATDAGVASNAPQTLAMVRLPHIHTHPSYTRTSYITHTYNTQIHFT